MFLRGSKAISLRVKPYYLMHIIVFSINYGRTDKYKLNTLETEKMTLDVCREKIIHILNFRVRNTAVRDPYLYL